jgi:hypothetical protein
MYRREPVCPPPDRLRLRRVAWPSSVACRERREGRTGQAHGRTGAGVSLLRRSGWCSTLERSKPQESIGLAVRLTPGDEQRTLPRCYTLDASREAPDGRSLSRRLHHKSAGLVDDFVGRGSARTCRPTQGGLRASKGATASCRGKGSEGDEPHERFRHGTRPDGAEESKPSRGGGTLKAERTGRGKPGSSGSSAPHALKGTQPHERHRNAADHAVACGWSGSEGGVTPGVDPVAAQAGVGLPPPGRPQDPEEGGSTDPRCRVQARLNPERM